MDIKLRLIFFSFVALCLFGQIVSAQECVNKLTPIGTGQMMLGKFNAKAAGGNAYTDGNPNAKLANTSAVKDEMKQMSEFNSFVRGYFANTTPNIIQQTFFTFEKGEDAGNRPCRNLVARNLNGVTATIFIPEFQAKPGPVVGVKVGLSKNPPGGKIASAVSNSDNSDGTTKWQISFNETALAETVKYHQRTNRRATSESVKAMYSKEFTEVLNRWFPPKNSTVPTDPTKRTN